MEPEKKQTNKFSDLSIEMECGLKDLQAVVYLSSTRLYSSGPCKCKKKTKFKKNFF